jgi:hypothetical protein
LPAPDLVDASDLGISNSDNITSTATPTMSGVAAAGSQVELLVDGQPVVTVAVENTGLWFVECPTLQEGTRAIAYRQLDEFGRPVVESETLTVVIDLTPPRLVNTSFFYQFSPHLIRLRFSEDLSHTFSASNVLMRNLTTSIDLDPSVMNAAFSSLQQIASITFPGLSGLILPDGNWRLSIDSSKLADVAGNTLASDVNFDFFFLTADANHDRRVDALDLDIVSTNLGSLVPGFEFGDFNYDGLVDLDDVLILMNQFGTSLPAPRPVQSSTPLSASDQLKTRSRLERSHVNLRRSPWFGLEQRESRTGKLGDVNVAVARVFNQLERIGKPGKSFDARRNAHDLSRNIGA